MTVKIDTSLIESWGWPNFRLGWVHNVELKRLITNSIWSFRRRLLWGGVSRFLVASFAAISFSLLGRFPGISCPPVVTIGLPVLNIELKFNLGKFCTYWVKDQPIIRGIQVSCVGVVQFHELIPNTDSIVFENYN